MKSIDVRTQSRMVIVDLQKAYYRVSRGPLIPNPPQNEDIAWGVLAAHTRNQYLPASGPQPATLAKIKIIFA